MSKRLLICAVALLVAAGMALAAGKEGSWTGWVSDTHCGVKGTSEKHADCAKKCVEGQNAKYALYTPNDKKVYVLEPQDKAAEHVAHYVAVMGTVEGDTIRITSVEATEQPKGSEKPSS